MIRHALYIAVAGLALTASATALVGLPPMVSESEINAGKAEIPPPQKTQPEPVQTERAPIGNPLWAIPLRQLSVTRDRPLFSPSRRPPPAVGNTVAAPAPVRAAPKPAEPERPPLSLVGTVIGDHDKIAVFVDQATKLVVRLRVGESHQGWMLQSVQARETTVQKDRWTSVIALPAPGQTASPLAAAISVPRGPGQIPTSATSGSAPPPWPGAAQPPPPATAAFPPPKGGGPLFDSGRQEAAKLTGAPLPSPPPTSQIQQLLEGKARNR